MTYPVLSLATDRSRVIDTMVQPAELSALEREVVLASLGDGPISIDGKRRLFPMLRWLFGFEPRPGLANSRLEALRRYAVMYRRDREAIDPAERTRIRAAGYSLDQAMLVRPLVDGPPRRNRRRRRRRRRRHSARRWLITVIILAAAVAVMVLGDVLIARNLGDGLIGWILMGAALATAAPFFASMSGRRPLR
jgi:hypothetical protein